MCYWSGRWLEWYNGLSEQSVERVRERIWALTRLPHRRAHRKLPVRPQRRIRLRVPNAHFHLAVRGGDGGDLPDGTVAAEGHLGRLLLFAECPEEQRAEQRAADGGRGGGRGLVPRGGLRDEVCAGDAEHNHLRGCRACQRELNMRKLPTIQRQLYVICECEIKLEIFK